MLSFRQDLVVSGVGYDGSFSTKVNTENISVRLNAIVNNRAWLSIVRVLLARRD